MNSKLKRISTKDMTEKDWLNYRMNGLGGSEIAAVLGLSPYESNVKLFYKKVGDIEETIEENEAMFAGKRQEAIIADDYWRYYDPEDKNPLNYIANYNSDKQIRKCNRINAFIINPDIPFAFASVDRIIHKGSNDKEGILECKTIASYAAKLWEEDIPPMYLAQVMYYLMVTELEYGELAMLKDGRNFNVIKFERNEEFISYLRESALTFWDLVTRARILKQEGKPYEHLEPAANNQEAYKDFLKERYKAEAKAIAPNAYYFELGEKIAEKKIAMDLIEEEIEGYKNEIAAYMKECDTMDFGPKSGKITYKSQKGKQSMDFTGFMEAHPELFDKFVKRGDDFRVMRFSLKSQKITELNKLKEERKAMAA